MKSSRSVLPLKDSHVKRRWAHVIVAVLEVAVRQRKAVLCGTNPAAVPGKALFSSFFC